LAVPLQLFRHVKIGHQQREQMLIGRMGVFGPQFVEFLPGPLQGSSEVQFPASIFFWA